MQGVLANCNDEDASQYINRKESVPAIIARLAERGITHGYHATNALIYAVTAGFKVNASAFRDVFHCTNDFYMVSGAAVTKENDDTSFHDYVDTAGEKGEAFGDVLRKHGIELSEHEQQLMKLAVILKVDLSGYLRFKQAAEVPCFTEQNQGELLCALCPPPPRFVKPWIVVK